METIAVQYCIILAIPKITIVTIVMIIALLLSFQEIQQSNLEHLVNVDMWYLVTAMSEECFICSSNHRFCKRKRGRKLGGKAQKSLVKTGKNAKRRFNYSCFAHGNICLGFRSML